MRASSIEAHENIKPQKQTHYREIKKAFQRVGNAVTSKQLAIHTSLDYHSVARRLSEMEKAGMIEVVGREPNIKNRPLLWSLKN